VVSHAFWQGQLGGDPAAIGRAIRLGGEAYTVVGVMPRDFAFPSPEVAVWIPERLMARRRRGRPRGAVARRVARCAPA
jgi:hypothetical protein